MENCMEGTRSRRASIEKILRVPEVNKIAYLPNDTLLEPLSSESGGIFILLFKNVHSFVVGALGRQQDALTPNQNGVLLPAQSKQTVLVLVVHDFSPTLSTPSHEFTKNTLIWP